VTNTTHEIRDKNLKEKEKHFKAVTHITVIRPNTPPVRVFLSQVCFTLLASWGVGWPSDGITQKNLLEVTSWSRPGELCSRLFTLTFFLLCKDQLILNISEK
jgi:hypothetical protein